MPQCITSCVCVCVQEMDINLEVEYTGRCEMAIDADLVSWMGGNIIMEIYAKCFRSLTRRPMLLWK